MRCPAALRLVCVIAVLGVTLRAQADSFTSSASSAGSASSGSVSGSLRGSSKSSTGGDDKRATVDYRIIDLTPVPDRSDLIRITMRPDDQQQQLVLELPQAIATRHNLNRGDPVQARQRVYGFEFVRGDTLAAFYLVLEDDWHADLAARPLGL